MADELVNPKENRNFIVENQSITDGIFCIDTYKITQSILIDDFCKEIEPHIAKKTILPSNKKTRKRAFVMSDSEMMTILVAFHLSQYRNLKAFYLMLCREWKCHFPKTFSYNCFVERQKMVAIKLRTIPEDSWFWTMYRVFHRRFHTYQSMPCEEKPSQQSLPWTCSEEQSNNGVVLWI